MSPSTSSTASECPLPVQLLIPAVHPSKATALSDLLRMSAVQQQQRHLLKALETVEEVVLVCSCKDHGWPILFGEPPACPASAPALPRRGPPAACTGTWCVGDRTTRSQHRRPCSRLPSPLPLALWQPMSGGAS